MTNAATGKTYTCPCCLQDCFLECTTSSNTSEILGSYLDCDCGYVSCVYAGICFERRPGQEGRIWKRFSPSCFRWLEDEETQRIIEEKIIEERLMEWTQ